MCAGARVALLYRPIEDLSVKVSALQQFDVRLVLHGTNGTGSGMLNAAFGDALFGAGQPLDAAKYFIILPDTIGAGKSSKPSDGLL